jgi:cytoskeleton protein RodZ
VNANSDARSSDSNTPSVLTSSAIPALLMDIGGVKPDESPVVVPAASLPGGQLRTVREARGMSISDVAGVLRFSPKQIELLESDRYDDLPGATFVRGFIRSYAKLLKLDVVPLLAALAPAVPPTPVEVIPPANMGEAAHSGLVDRGLGKRIPWGTIVAAVVIMMAIGLVLYVVQTAGLFSMLGGVSSAKVDTSPTSPTTPVAPELQTLPSSAPSVAAEANAPAPASVIMPPTIPLVAEFDERSWIEVRDVAQKVIFVGEYPKGTRQVIDGQAPFQIWIGKASAVRLTYGDRKVDLKPHTREDVARFTLE